MFGEPRDDLPPPAFHLDPDLVDEFVSGRLDHARQAELADQVARLLPFHHQLPNPVTAALLRVAETLGGDERLMDWLDQYPGRPRVTARVYGVIVFLDSWSANPGVVQALAERRAEEPYPAGLAGHLVPDTNSATLASLSTRIEELLGDDRLDEAVTVALRSLALLAELGPRAAALDPRATSLPDQARTRSSSPSWRSVPSTAAACPVRQAAGDLERRPCARRAAIRRTIIPSSARLWVTAGHPTKSQRWNLTRSAATAG